MPGPNTDQSINTVTNSSLTVFVWQLYIDYPVPKKQNIHLHVNVADHIRSHFLSIISEYDHIMAQYVKSNHLNCFFH